MKKKHQPGCPCCDCDYFLDTFNRSNDTDVGGNYVETSGDWSITASSLLIQDDDALLEIDVAHPDALPDGVLGVSFYPFDLGDEIKIYVDYADADNHFYVKITAGDPDGGIELYERASASDTLLASVKATIPEDEFTRVYVYWGERKSGDYEFVAYIPPTEGQSAESVMVSADPGGAFTNDAKYLGTGNITVAVYFNDLQLWKHHDIDDNPDCYEAPPWCFLANDSFDDYSTPGLSWTTTGTWSIVADIDAGTTDDARATANGDKLTLANPHPYPGTLRISTAINIEATGGSAKIWVDGGIYLNVSIPTDDEITAQLFEDGVGSLEDAQTVDLTSAADAYVAIEICYDGERVDYRLSFTSLLIAGSEEVNVTPDGIATIESTSANGFRVAYAVAEKTYSEDDNTCRGCSPPVPNCCVSESSGTLPSTVRVELGAAPWYTDHYCTTCADSTTGPKLLPYIGDATRTQCLWLLAEGSCDFGLNGITSATIVPLLQNTPPAPFLCGIGTNAGAGATINDLRQFVHRLELVRVAGVNYWDYTLWTPVVVPAAAGPIDPGDCSHSVRRFVPCAYYRSDSFTKDCDDFPFTLTKTQACDNEFAAALACRRPACFGRQTFYPLVPARSYPCRLGTIPNTITIWPA